MYSVFVHRVMIKSGTHLGSAYLLPAVRLKEGTLDRGKGRHGAAHGLVGSAWEAREARPREAREARILSWVVVLSRLRR